MLSSLPAPNNCHDPSFANIMQYLLVPKMACGASLNSEKKLGQFCELQRMGKSMKTSKNLGTARGITLSVLLD